MFFRNHMPSEERLREMLAPRRGTWLYNPNLADTNVFAHHNSNVCSLPYHSCAGWAAYCCQCSWVSVAPEDGAVCIRKAGGAPMPPPDAALASRTGGNGWQYWSCSGHAAGDE